jgi:hypothetical protein
MAQAGLDYRQLVSDELTTMNACIEQQRQAYFAFLTVAQMHDWEAAAACQLQASASGDAAMDAFMRACRAMEEGSRSAQR